MKAVGIDRIAAVTPGFGGVEALFEAWCAGERGSAETGKGGDFMAMSRGVLHTVMEGAGKQGGGMGVILATTKGDMAEQVRWMRGVDAGDRSCGPAPTLGGTLRRVMGARHFAGPCHVVSTACTSGLVAMIEAAMLLADGEAEEMVALGADVAGDFVREGFGALRALSPTVCRPFDEGRDGLALGSGAAGCLLSRVVSSETACVLSGWGISNDATHMTAPDRAAGGLIRAIRAALASARLGAADIDVVLAHGTGTKYNDAMEAAAVEAVFLGSGCSPMVTAAKGFLGHTLGASGLVEAVLAVEMLRRGVVPAVTGLRLAEWKGIDFVMSVRKGPIRHVLKMASGFGGMNAAVILSRVEGGA